MAQAREKRRVEEQAAAAIRQALPDEFVAELEGKNKGASKRRRIEGSFGLKGYEVPEEIWYARGPNSVNPAGRETEGQDGRWMIEQAAEGSAQGDKREKEQEGMFSSQTLEALRVLQQTADGTSGVQTKSSDVGSRLALVDYGSDSD